MLDHVTRSVTDLARAQAFYDAALAGSHRYRPPRRRGRHVRLLRRGRQGVLLDRHQATAHRERGPVPDGRDIEVVCHQGKEAVLF